MTHFEKRLSIFRDLGARDEVLEPLENYIELLWDANAHLNLVSRKMTKEEFIDNHVIDCLLPLNFFPQDIKIAADFGSGGGLPGVVYAICFPEIRFRLYENSRLKQDFLRQCKSLVPNLDILGEIPPRLEHIDLAVSRAFKPIDVLLEMTRHYYTSGGKYFLLKARREKIDEEIASARKVFRDLKITIHPLKSPVLDVERHLVLIN